MNGLPKRVDPPTFNPPPRMPLGQTLAVAAVLSVIVWVVSNVLHRYGINRAWSLLITLILGFFLVELWKVARLRKRADAHEKWVSGLGSGFSHRLKVARLEATRWKRRK